MKQLKFFTNHADTLKATQYELERKGITAEKLHIFVRDNSQHSFDGLVLQTEKKQENYKVRLGTLVFVVLTFLAALGLLNGWINFLGFALIIAVYSVIPLITKRDARIGYSSKETLKKVYFLIVDVKENEERLVESVAKHHADLIPQ